MQYNRMHIHYYGIQWLGNSYFIASSTVLTPTGRFIRNTYNSTILCSEVSKIIFFSCLGHQHSIHFWATDDQQEWDELHGVSGGCHNLQHPELCPGRQVLKYGYFKLLFFQIKKQNNLSIWSEREKDD
jgi:hypothetical protein